MKELGPHIYQLGKLTQAGQEDICDRIEQLHALIKKTFKPQHAGGGSGGNAGRLEKHLHQVAGVPRAGANGGNPVQLGPGAAGANRAKMEADKKSGGDRDQKDTDEGGDNEAQGSGRETN